MSQAVDTLVGRGFVSRRQNTQDRRCVWLELTPNGNDQLDTIFRSDRLWLTARLSPPNDEDINAILQAGEALNEAFEEHPIG